VQRFIKLLGQYAWDASAVRKFFHFYEALKFDGMHGRQHYKLTPIQCFQFASIYGFKKADGHRLTRTAYLFVPRKFSKTTSSASLAVYDLFCGDNNAQAYVAANSYPQASICFREIKAIVKGIDRRGKHFRVNREKIFWIDGSRASSASCLSSNPKTLDGLNASTVIIDEYAQARDPSLKNVLVSSMGIRTNPLVIIITTASSVLNGPFIEELGHVLAILRGEEQNDTVFASIFMPDVDDQEGDRATWAKVQPHLGITAREDFYENAWNDAQRSAKDMLEFRTKLLNVFCIDERSASWESSTSTRWPRERRVPWPSTCRCAMTIPPSPTPCIPRTPRSSTPTRTTIFPSRRWTSTRTASFTRYGPSKATCTSRRGIE
jgi:phage terminase large subunit-like protein